MTTRPGRRSGRAFGPGCPWGAARCGRRRPMSPSRPKVLRKLKIDEFSFCDVPCNADSTVLVWKRGGGVAEAPNLGAGSATSMTEAERVAKAVEDKVNA